MKINKNLREAAAKCIKGMQPLEALLSEVESLQCDSNLEGKIKELLQKEIETSITGVLITVSTLCDVESALEGETDLLSTYKSAFENINGYRDESID